jgi:hypothetical protein
VRDDPCTWTGKLIELHRFFIFASRIAFVDGALNLITDPDPLVAGKTDYTFNFTREHDDPQDFSNVQLLFGGEVLTQFLLTFAPETHMLTIGEVDLFTFSTPG